jgi:hypothetical protein
MPPLCVLLILICSDAAEVAIQLLNFLKMSFYLFSVCAFFAVTILMPINYKVRSHGHARCIFP